MWLEFVFFEDLLCPNLVSFCWQKLKADILQLKKRYIQVMTLINFVLVCRLYKAKLYSFSVVIYVYLQVRIRSF